MLSSGELALNMLRRLSLAVTWLAIVLAHCCVLLLALTAAWALDYPADRLLEAARPLLQSSAVAVPIALGVTALGLAGAYLRLLQWAARRIAFGWLFRFLTKGLAP